MPAPKLPVHTDEVDHPNYADWAEFHAEQIKSSGRRLGVCRICRTIRIPADVHACHLCY